MDWNQRNIISVGLIIVLVAAAVGIVYLSVMPGVPQEGFTELYLLNSQGQAANYTENLTVGEEQSFRIGVTNREQQSMRYSLVIRLEGREISSQTISLQQSETWEDEFTFTPREAGDKNLKISLYRGQVSTGSSPYRSVWLNFTAVR